MKKLTGWAAALAAGVMVFAANAQEAPAPAAMAEAGGVKAFHANETLNVKTGRESFAMVDIGDGAPAPKTDPASAGPAKVAAESEKPAKAEAATKPAEIDETKTAAVEKRKKPDLIATARKSVKGEAEEIAADAKAGMDPARGGKYGALISRYAAKNGVPVALAHAVVRIESNYRPNARGKAGEIGLMQIKPATARLMGYTGDLDGLFNPETNIRFGMKYLGKAHRLGGGSTCGTILKYNAGHSARRMNPVSAAYCRKVKLHLG
jgi:soluble lytic murein transglycosylase-like protein